MADNKTTHVVIHPSLYLRGKGGKLEQQEVGQELVLSKSQGASMVKKGFVKVFSTKKPVDK